MSTMENGDVMRMREYVDLRIKALRERLDGLEANIAMSLEAHNKAHDREHEMTETAVTKAEEAMTLRLEAMNEFRAQITAERALYITRAEFARFEEGNAARIKENSLGIAEQRNMWSRLQGQITLVGIVPVIISVFAVIVSLWQMLGG